MSDRTPGIHHVTSVTGDPADNLAFYTEVLGLRFVKRTVNFDDTSTYHLYYGDRVGTPGTALTFFPFENATPGRVGSGQVETTGFVVPDGSIDDWAARFDDYGVDYDDPVDRFGDRTLAFRDPTGLRYELVETTVPDTVDAWTDVVDESAAIAGFNGAVLDSTRPDATADVLELLGFERDGTDGDRTRYLAGGNRAQVVDLVDADGPRGTPGTGTVHHVAFRVADADRQEALRERLLDAGYSVTPVRDRRYFESIYFREPGGILFEIATDGPGFDRDEPVAQLGTSLCLPPWLADDRATIEAQLPDLEIPELAQR